MIIEQQIIDKIIKAGAKTLVIKHVHKSKGTPKGGLCVIAKKGGYAIKTISRSFSIAGPENAYNEIIEAANQLHKALQIPLKTQSLESILSKVEEGPRPTSKRGGEIDPANPLMDKFGNLVAFKSMLRHAHKVHGYDRVKTVLNTGLEYLEDFTEEERALNAANQKALQTVANGLVKICLETGFDMIDNCGTPELKREYRRQLAKSKLAGSHNQAVTNVYQLNGEKWDGLGNPPPSFIKWMKEHDKNSFDELRAG